MPAKAKSLRALEISLHFCHHVFKSLEKVAHSQLGHGLVSLANTFTCLLTRLYIFSQLMEHSSLLILLHFSSVQLT